MLYFNSIDRLQWIRGEKTPILTARPGTLKISCEEELQVGFEWQSTNLTSWTLPNEGSGSERRTLKNFREEGVAIGFERPSPGRRAEARLRNRCCLLFPRSGSGRPCKPSVRRTQWTNRPIEGRVSVDRSKVAALALTTPRPVGESSRDDSAPPHHTSFEPGGSGQRAQGRHSRVDPRNCSDYGKGFFGLPSANAGGCLSLPSDGWRHTLSLPPVRRTSGLEAFSR
ncbi:hypothetical protein NPIL_163601 [Nephila pilipes]|uniref:Uncharacterized protein n=1 Tax=Nephila pilipes TaxID=299642 RepID=A0A8X6MSB8_NEPPI|nr:hypothetical protein NPIL_163601 [Nephila pilipes]